MGYNTKNYTEQGGAKTVIGGTLEIADGGVVTGLTDVANIVDNLTTSDAAKALSAKQGKALKDAADLKVAANQAANATTTATTLETAEALANALKTDFNALLAKLKAAGLMVAD